MIRSFQLVQNPGGRRCARARGTSLKHRESSGGRSPAVTHKG
jgi:hypothetical protein